MAMGDRSRRHHDRCVWHPRVAMLVILAAALIAVFLRDRGLNAVPPGP